MANKKQVPKCVWCEGSIPYWFGPSDQAHWKRTYPDKAVPQLTRGVDGQGYFCSKNCATAYAHEIIAGALPRNPDGHPEN